MNLLQRYSTLFAPSPSLKDRKERERAQMFAWFTFHIVPLIVGVIFLQSFVDLKEYTPLPIPLGNSIIVASIFLYFFARSVYFHIGIYVQIITNCIFCSYIILYVAPSESATIFAFSIGITSGAILLPFRQFIYSTLFVLSFMIFSIIAHPNPPIFIGSLVITGITTGLICIIRFNLEQAEIARKKQGINEDKQHIDFIKSIFDGVAYVKDERFVDIDPKFAKILGMNPNTLVGASIHMALPPNIDLSTPLQTISMLDNERGILFLQILYEKRHYRAKQIIAVRDITNQTMHQEQLIFTNKMISTGMLTASIVHDISSPLMVLQHSLDDIRESYTPPIAMLQSLSHISSLFDSLRHYIRPQENSVSTQLIIERAVQLIRPRIRCSIQKEIPPLPKSHIPQHQLLQILLNLLINASQVADKNGYIRIVGAQKENFISITIEDTGPGIPRKIQHRIFDPFFTTKENGTGLGLAISQKIITTYGGTLVLDSSYTEGCRFVLSFPQRIQESPILKKILIVDDEPLICELIEEALEDYPTHTVQSAEEALLLLQKNSYSLILCDITLHQKSGWEVFEKWKEQQLGAFVFISGGIHLLPNSIDLEHERVGLLSKPFHLKQLYSIVEEYFPKV